MAKDKIVTTNYEFMLNIDLAPAIHTTSVARPLEGIMGRDMSTLYKDLNYFTEQVHYNSGERAVRKKKAKEVKAELKKEKA